MCVLLLASLSSCTSWDNFYNAFIKKEEAPAKTVRIAVFEPLTGNEASGAEAEIEGIRLANSLYRTANGSRVELVYFEGYEDRHEALSREWHLKRAGKAEKEALIRDRGICLYGMPINEAFGEVPEQDYLDSIWHDVSRAEEEITGNPMYLILNLARVLGYLRKKRVFSKKEGGTWGLKNLPERYRPLIQAALDEYENGNEVQYDTVLARDYADYMLRQITRGQMDRMKKPLAEQDA